MKKNSSNSFRKTVAKDLGAWLLLMPALLIIYFFTIRPLITGVWYSLHELRGFEILEFCGLDNYRDIVMDTRFMKVLFNTLKYVFWSLTIGFLPPIALAIMLNEMCHGKGIFKFFIYFPAMVPGLVVSLLWYYMYMPDASGLLNTFLMHLGMEPFAWLQNEKLTIILIVIMATWNGCGGTTIMYLASLSSVNSELYEAAALDGAGFFTRIRTITLPSISNIILLFAAQQIIGVFQIMEQPLAMTGGGPNYASMSLALWNYYNGFVSFNTGGSLATGVITFLILMVLTSFYFLLQKKVERD